MGVFGCVVVVTAAVVVVELLPRPRWIDGNWTGVRNTMMQTTATRQPPASSSNFLLCSMAPRRTAKKKPLKRKKRTMLTELFTAAKAYQKLATCAWNHHCSGRGIPHSEDGRARVAVSPLILVCVPVLLIGPMAVRVHEIPMSVLVDVLLGHHEQGGDHDECESQEELPPRSLEE